ncbi:MAG: beta-N-acetylhexosaminidase [Clostridia bacterium]|nr:beta-N-acetylhexosaminidase [Clostridia bacterium]
MLKINFNGDIADVSEGLSLVAGRLGIELDDSGICVEVKKVDKGLAVSGTAGAYTISYSTKVEFFRALSLVVDKIKKDEKNFSINEEAKIATSGFMVDLSRCAVMTVDTVKDVIERMSLMGLNMLMLYTEDSYELEKYPYFGYMRGAYSKEELKELDAYALKFGVELIPCIQTLAHLGAALRWRAFGDVKDTSTVLLVGEEKTYELIEEMIKTCREIFTTDRIHIGMDEAFDIGTGGYFRRNGYVPTADIMAAHLKRVSAIVDKHGYKPMMWSDMFFTSCNDEKYYYIPETQFPEDFKKSIPENLQMVYWDYEGDHEERYDGMITAHERLEHDIVFAGAVWSWSRLCPNFQKTFMASRAALASCKKHGVQTAFMTIWGNGGTQTNFYENLPALQLWADLTYNDEVSDELFADRFHACTGYNLADFMLLSCDDFPVDDIIEHFARTRAFLCINTSIQIFYQDLLYGLLDKNFRDYDFKSHYKSYLDAIEKVGDQGDMNDIFEIHKVLYRILVSKSDMGIRLTDSYLAGDKATLGTLVVEMGVMLEDIMKLHGMYYDLWHKTNKPFGWEQFDGRLGGLEARIRTTIRRVSQFVSGEVSSLPEFEAERLYFDGYDKAMVEVAGVHTFDRPCITD